MSLNHVPIFLPVHTARIPKNTSEMTRSRALNLGVKAIGSHQTHYDAKKASDLYWSFSRQSLKRWSWDVRRDSFPTKKRRLSWRLELSIGISMLPANNLHRIDVCTILWKRLLNNQQDVSKLLRISCRVPLSSIQSTPWIDGVMHGNGKWRDSQTQHPILQRMTCQQLQKQIWFGDKNTSESWDWKQLNFPIHQFTIQSSPRFRRFCQIYNLLLNLIYIMCFFLA